MQAKSFSYIFAGQWISARVGSADIEPPKILVTPERDSVTKALVPPPPGVFRENNPYGPQIDVLKHF